MGSHSGGGLGQAQGLHDGLWAGKAELFVGIPGGEQNQQSVFGAVRSLAETKQRAKCLCGDFTSFLHTAESPWTWLSAHTFLLLFPAVQLSLGTLPGESNSKTDGWFVYF